MTHLKCAASVYWMNIYLVCLQLIRTRILEAAITINAPLQVHVGFTLLGSLVYVHVVRIEN